VTIDNLPDDVLLEIFDLYRHTFGDPLSSERVWNNKNGWFKLAHVCLNWRSVVLASPSRLRLRLYFAEDTLTRAAVLERLSHLPIVVDYSKATLNFSTQERLISALRYPDRVCRIAITYDDPDWITEALDSPFPALESLELDCFIFPTSFMTLIQSLRYLRLISTSPTSLTSFLPLLSVTRALVDLNLTIDTVFCTAKGASLLTHLQSMPHLRNLQVFTGTTYHFFSDSFIEMPPTMPVLLTELTCFRFSGECVEIEWFVAGLVTPSLRELHISALDTNYHTDTLHAPYLYKFVCAAGIVFFAARLTFSGHCLTTSLFAYPHSSDDSPSKIVTIKTQFGTPPDSAVSAMLATIEDLFLSLKNPQPESYHEDLESWRKVFEEFRNVKVLRLHRGLKMKVADMLRQLTINSPPPQEDVNPNARTPLCTPINGNSQSTLDIFPSLEEIVLYASRWICEAERRCGDGGLEPFGPFVTARREVGHPVNVFWKSDGEFPRYYSSMYPGNISW
jgi:F-box-like